MLRDVKGKPIENAAVVFHPMEGEKDKGNMELKTNEDGKTIIDVMPIGDTVRVQVIAKGFQTFGGDYKIDKPSGHRDPHEAAGRAVLDLQERTEPDAGKPAKRASEQPRHGLARRRQPAPSQRAHAISRSRS